MDLPKRKTVRLQGYDYSQIGAYFITICTQNKLPLFGEIVGATLRDILDWFKTMTTNEYIRGVKNALFPPFDKRIWQRSYHDHIIRVEQDYNKICNYIDTNPQKMVGRLLLYKIKLSRNIKRHADFDCQHGVLLHFHKI